MVHTFFGVFSQKGRKTDIDRPVGESHKFLFSNSTVSVRVMHWRSVKCGAWDREQTADCCLVSQFYIYCKHYSGVLWERDRPYWVEPNIFGHDGDCNSLEITDFRAQELQATETLPHTGRRLVSYKHTSIYCFWKWIWTWTLALQTTDQQRTEQHAQHWCAD